MKAKTKKDRAYFPRPAENLPSEEAIDKISSDFLLWVADQEEIKGNLENAARLRSEAAKPIEKNE